LADRLTLIDLLSHQTGLERLDAFWLGAENEVLVAKDLTVAAINQLSPVYPLRTKWMYNN
jgi:CubicO group peptidase (beta-lactamase class C family)